MTYRLFVLILSFVLVSPVSSAFAGEGEPYSTKATPIGDLMGDPEAADIVKKHIAMFAEPESTDSVRPYTLHSLKIHSQGQITNELLDMIDDEFIELSKSRK